LDDSRGLGLFDTSHMAGPDRFAALQTNLPKNSKIGFVYTEINFRRFLPASETQPTRWVEYTLPKMLLVVCIRDASAAVITIELVVKLREDVAGGRYRVVDPVRQLPDWMPTRPTGPQDSPVS
jgi:hypothetical protein